jgi:hypothetical protein
MRGWRRLSPLSGFFIELIGGGTWIERPNMAPENRSLEQRHLPRCDLQPITSQPEDELVVINSAFAKRFNAGQSE